MINNIGIIITLWFVLVVIVACTQTAHVEILAGRRRTPKPSADDYNL